MHDIAMLLIPSYNQHLATTFKCSAFVNLAET